MNPVFENMTTRRSIRAFKPDAVPQELIDQIIEAGLWAACGRSTQNPIIIQVSNPEKMDELRKLNGAVVGREGGDPFYGAPCTLIVLAKKSVATYVYDGSLVLGNMMNMAHALGVDSIWIHRAKEEFEHEWGKQLLAELGIPADEYEGIGHCALGYHAGEYPQAVERKPNRVYYVK